MAGRLILLAMLAALVGCYPAANNSSKVPAEFGYTGDAKPGCPKLSGIYAWPPVQGAFAGGN
jgi:hypothetical protein